MSSLTEENKQTFTTSEVANAHKVNDQQLQTPSSVFQVTPKESPISVATPHRSTFTPDKCIQIDTKGDLTNIYKAILIITLFLAYQTLLQKLISIQQQNNQILTLLEQNNATKLNNDAEVPDFPVSVPLQSHEDLHILETYLESSNKNIVVTFFKLL